MFKVFNKHKVIYNGRVTYNLARICKELGMTEEYALSILSPENVIKVSNN